MFSLRGYFHLARMGYIVFVAVHYLIVICGLCMPWTPISLISSRDIHRCVGDVIPSPLYT